MVETVMKTARIELLTPELDMTVRFIPGYDLYEKKLAGHNELSTSPEQITAIALALWEISGEEPQQTTRSLWPLAKQEFYRGA